jgi:N-acetyl sugar amidotransferase
MDYQICAKTIMDTSDPHISFDENSISNHYWDFHNQVKPNWYPNENGNKILEEKIEAIKRAGKGKDFDCILGLSGGVDSSYMLHKVVNDFGLRPLVFHVDGGWNSELAVHNIQVLVDKLGLDLFTEVINWEEMKDFQLAWFKSGVPHIDIPQDHAFVAVLYKFAEKYKIKTILNGGNISTECVMRPLQYFYWGTDMKHINDVISRFGSIPMKTYPFSNVFRHKIYLKYFKNVGVFKPLNFMPYTKELAINTLQNEYSWKPYKQKHFESRFTKFFEAYWLPTRFGFDVRRVNLSSLILTDQMTREEALNEMENLPYDKNNIDNEFEYIATKLGISVNELREYHQMPLKFYSDYKNQHKILKRIEGVVNFLNIGRRGGAY